MTVALDDREFQQRLQALDALLREAEQNADPESRSRLQQIVQTILDLHGVGLERLLKHVAESGEPGRNMLDAFAGDDLVGCLLLLHQLHPRNVEERVLRALDGVRPYLASHGGNVELVGIRDGVVRLRLEGNCHHCPSSTVTMKQTIEEAIFIKAPEVTAVQVEDTSAPGSASIQNVLPILQM